MGENFLKVQVGMKWKISLHHTSHPSHNIQSDSKGQQPLPILGFIQKTLVYTHTHTHNLHF